MSQPNQVNPATEAILSKLPAPEVRLVHKDDVQPHPDNPRQGNIGLIFESIMENGWYGHIYVQKSTGHIFIHNHSYKAGVEAGMEHFPALVYDIDDLLAKRLMLVDNRASDDATYDDPKLAELLIEQAEQADPLLSGTGYNPNELDEIIENQELPLDFENDRRLTTAERKAVYESTTVRQIMLITDYETYEWMIEQLGKVMQQESVGTNVEAVIRLLEKATGEVYGGSAADN